MNITDRPGEVNPVFIGHLLTSSAFADLVPALSILSAAEKTRDALFLPNSSDCSFEPNQP